MGTIPKVGAFVLESLTTGMYTEPLDAVREFVQNSADAIRAAEESDLLHAGHGRIELAVDAQNRALTVRDNGGGVSRDEAVRRLVDIGMSDKDIAKDAGFRGIGRLAGIAYCDELWFRTSAPDEATATVVYFDCASLRSAISPTIRERRELADVLAEHSAQDEERCSRSDHYFEVELKGITEAGAAFLDWRRLEDYLCQAAPVCFDAQRFSLATVIRDWLKNRGITLPTATLLIRGDQPHREVFKPYKTHYKTVKTREGGLPFHIKTIRFFPEDATPESPFWLWYGESDLLGSIDDRRSAGLRLRKDNIALGGADRVAELFGEVAESNRRFNRYFIGEVHVTARDAVPNARRDGLEDIGSWPEARESLMPFVQRCCEQVRRTSTARNRPVAKVTASAEKVIADARERLDGGLVSKDERDRLLGKVTKEAQKASRIVAVREGTEDGKRVRTFVKQLEKLKADLEGVRAFAVGKVKPSLDRKQRRILRDVLAIIDQTMLGHDCPKRSECEKKLRAAILEEFQVKEEDGES